jgi:hypothetical protein
MIRYFFERLYDYLKVKIRFRLWLKKVKVKEVDATTARTEFGLEISNHSGTSHQTSIRLPEIPD